MSEINKTYRIRATVGEESFIPLHLEQEYDVLDVLSLKIRSKDTFKLHNSNVGIIVGRVQANNGFGIPNAKVSVFIQSTEQNGTLLRNLYPFTNAASKTKDGVRYNLLPDEKTGDCHQIVGTFPNKRYVLDNDIILEVFDKYYKYTTKTNNSGDYLLAGIPTGSQTVHVDIDLSDCGILSQRPRDFVYKGYTIEQFESPNMFKSGTEYGNLSQVFSQNKSVYVYPYWGNESLGEEIGLTRLDFDIAYKFEPTCVFIGSVISDNSSQGISKKCIPTENMGNMDELVSGKGTIEMIRKTIGGDVEEFQINGTELINGDGIWCYQIPMNLDYMMTDEYGNMVPTDSPDKGIPTRARVRFRVSMEDMEDNTNNFFRAKILVPHNPQNTDGSKHELYDYEFGSFTKDESFRDLFWNNVYSVKSYIPRIQKKKVLGWKTKKFTGIKGCQNFGSNNPLPYNNIRIHLPLMFTVMCLLLKAFIRITAIFNSIIAGVGNAMANLANVMWSTLILQKPAKKVYALARNLKLNVIEDGICPDLENWYFAPLSKNNIKTINVKHKLSSDDDDEFNILQQTLDSLVQDDGTVTPKDEMSIDIENADTEDESVCVTTSTNYLISCMEMNLALEYKVINFDFYNDWINGVLYFPRWMRDVRTKRSINGTFFAETKIKSCMDNTAIFSKARRYTQLCSLGYEANNYDSHTTFSRVNVKLNNKSQINKANKFHKKSGITQVKIFGKNGGICHQHKTMIGQYVYYLKPCEWTYKTAPQNRKVTLFATDIILLGSLNSCDLFGLPQAFSHLGGTTYIMPPNLALTNLETESALFTAENGRLCSKKNSSSTDTMGLSMIDGEINNPLTSELLAYSGVSDNYDVQFNGDENDTIALTELAGISWNYVGPGQGTNVPKHLYYPGGHFLGLSCANSQTNIKSCVNLERICEAGASMSQRKDEVSAVIDGDVKYVYTVPSGLISGGDIVDPDFRAMFATMNQKRLIADTINKDTGYLNYDFLFVKPNNFNGELNTYGSSVSYNKRIQITDESETLSAFGISDSSELQDTDATETGYTQVKTIEKNSVDYYRFRLGLDYDNLNKTNGKHIRQFAVTKGNKYYLPQYENSFYFYFGLKAGATAIDEFNKQFFSECEQSNLIEYDYGVRVHVDDYNFVSGSSQVTFEIVNMTPGYIYSINTLDDKQYVTGTTEDSEFVLDIPYGSYYIIIRDSEGLNSKADFVVGENVKTGVLNVQNFTLPISKTRGLDRNYANKNLFYGGFVELSEAILDSDVQFVNKYLVLFNKDSDPETTYPIFNTIINDSGYAIYYLKYKDVESDAYIRYKCIGGDYVWIFLETITITDNSRLGLSIGSPISYNFSSIASASSIVWWDNGNTNTNFNDSALSGWSIRNAIIKRNSSAYTYSSGVFPVGGDKMLFGSLQNYNNIYIAQNKKLYSSDYIEDWENGYTLDDSVSYWATYGKNYTPSINQYQAITVDGFDVMGKWVAKVSGKTGITKEVVLELEDTSSLRDGGGCVLKSVTSPAIVGCVYHEDNHTIECLCDINEANSIEYGIVYPTIHYPVIKKDFTVSTNYFYFSIKNLLLPTSTNDNSLVVETVDVHEFLECLVRNGLTYKGFYSGKSFISGAFKYMPYSEIVAKNGEIRKKAKPNMSLFYLGENYDMAGIGPQSTSTSIFEFSEVNAFPDYNRHYEFIEGFPLHKSGSTYLAYSATTGSLYENASLYEDVAEKRSLQLSPNFYDEINYAIDSASTHLRFVGVGASDYDVEYYYCDRSDEDLQRLMITGYLPLDRKYVYAVRDEYDNFREFYMLCKYTSKNPTALIGAEFSIKVSKVAFKKWYMANVPVFTVTEDELGESSYTPTFVECLYEKGSDYDVTDMPTMATIIEYHTSGHVKCVHNVSPKVENIIEPGKQTDLNSFTSTLLPKLTNDKKITLNTTLENTGINPDDIFIVGIARYNSDMLASGNVCKIYSTLRQIAYIE